MTEITKLEKTIMNASKIQKNGDVHIVVDYSPKTKVLRTVFVDEFTGEIEVAADIKLDYLRRLSYVNLYCHNEALTIGKIPYDEDGNVDWWELS